MHRFPFFADQFIEIKNHEFNMDNIPKPKWLPTETGCLIKKYIPHPNREN
jgi:hypothetical protein